MTEEEVRRLNSHYEALAAQQRVFSEGGLLKSGVVEQQAFEMFARAARDAVAEFPAIVPRFDEYAFFSHENRQIDRQYYHVLAIRSYLGTAIARIRTALDEGAATTPPALRITREGVFFAGQYFDALRRLTEVLEQAQRTIDIIDGYVDHKLLEILTCKSPGAEVKILTKSLAPATRVAAEAFEAQYGNLSIRTSDAFHDRFLILDESEYYHFGASLKDVGRRGFMFSKIEEPAVIEAIRGGWKEEWAKASRVI